MKPGFETEFLELMQRVTELADKHSLPAPTMVFPPHWRAPVMSMESMGRSNNVDPRKVCGVRIEYGDVQPGMVLR